MPPRLPICSRCLNHVSRDRRKVLLQCRYASIASAITPAPSISQMTISPPPLALYPPTQPPSHRPPEFRKSQLHRQYTSLLRSNPLMLLFQHNNLKSTEWMGIRREVTQALRKVDDAEVAAGRPSSNAADSVKVQIIQAGVFEAALLVVDYFRPELQPEARSPHPSDPATQSSTVLPNTYPTPTDRTLTHALSRAAHDAVADKKLFHGLRPLLSGPLAVVTFPTVSPQHMKAVLSILSPKAPGFQAPTRRANPGYHDATVQAGLQKMMLLGARVEGKAFDPDGARWVGGIEGGLDGLRAQLVGMLQGIGAGLTNVLEGAGRSLYFTVEGRRGMLEEEEKAEGEGEGKNGEPPAQSWRGYICMYNILVAWLPSSRFVKWNRSYHSRTTQALQQSVSYRPLTVGSLGSFYS